MQICQNDTFAKSTLDEIAKELNMSKRNLQRALRIERNLTDSMKELLDTGEITKTFASDTIASLSENHIIFPYHPTKTKHKFEKLVDKYKHMFYTYLQWNTKRPIQNHTNGVGSTSDQDRSSYIHTNSMPKWLRIWNAETRLLLYYIICFF